MEEGMAKHKVQESEFEENKPSAATAKSDSHAEIPPTESSVEHPAEQSTDAAEPQKKQVDVVGRHRINLGDGRHLALSRSNRWQQMRIEFLADRDEVDPRPSKEDTEFLKQNGFRWRGEEKAWTRQLAKNTEENWAARGNSDLEAHQKFVELANRIRQRNGLSRSAVSAARDAKPSSRSLIDLPYGLDATGANTPVAGYERHSMM
jgi:hypothetical protein